MFTFVSVTVKKQKGKHEDVGDDSTAVAEGDGGMEDKSVGRLEDTGDGVVNDASGGGVEDAGGWQRGG